MSARRPRSLRLLGWMLAANASALVVALALAAPGSAAGEVARDAVRGFVAWCGIG